MKKLSLLAPVLTTLVVACSKTPPEPIGQVPEHRTETVPSAGASATLSTATTPIATPAPAVTGTSGVVQRGGSDPLAGAFSLKDATKDLPGTGPLLATIDTSKGKLECKLLEGKAPNTVANFVGLARGLRPWKDGNNWVKRPAYDDTVFHRIIAGFMIQGGDAKGNGTGEPGYTIADEVWPGAKHDRAGLLCMANRGPNTNGAQFFITDAAAAHLDGGYTIFGECEPVSTVHDIAKVEVDGEKPVTPVTIRSVRISRGTDAKAPPKKL